MANKKLKDLDIQNLHLLSTPAQFALAGLVVVSVLTLLYFAIFRDQMENLSAAEDKEVQLKETYTKKSIEAASLNNLTAELASIRSAFNVLLKQLPTDAEIPTLIQELHQAGSSNGLRLDSVLPQPTINDGPIQKLPYEIAVTGKFNQITQFTRDVGELSRIITLESLKLGSASQSKDTKSDLLTLNATATTYKARPAEEVAAELAASAASAPKTEQTPPSNDKNAKQK